MDSFSVLARNLSFPGTRPYNTIFRYSHRFYHFRYSFGQFFGTRTESFYLGNSPGFHHFRYSHGFYHFRYSYGEFFGSRMESFFSGNSPGCYYFSIFARILPFSVLIWTVFQYSHGIFFFREHAHIIQFFDTRIDSTIFGTHMDSFSILERNLSF